MNDPQQYQDYGNVPSGQNSQYFQQYVLLRNSPLCQQPVYMPSQNFCPLYFSQNIQTHIPETPIPESIPQPTYSQNYSRSEPRRRNVLDIFDPISKEKIDFTNESVPVNTQPYERTNSYTPRPLIVSDPPRKSSNLKIQPAPIPTVQPVPEVQKITSDVENLDVNKNPVIIEDNGTYQSALYLDASEEKKIDFGESEVEDNLDSSSESISSLDISAVVSSRSSVKSVEDEDVDRVLKYDRAKLLELRKTSETTIPIMEQSSISINQNDRLRNNYRRERQRRCLTLKTDVKLDDVDNAYKPAHLRRDEVQDDRENQISRSLNLVLNRLLDDNITEIVTEIKKISISGPEEMQCFVKILTAKATRQTKYCKVFAKLCVELSKNKTDKFKMFLVSAVNKLFETPLEKHIEEVNANIDAKIAETSDEKVKKMLEEDRETAVSKRRESFLGIIQFFGQLFIEKLIPDKSASESLKAFSKPKSQDEVLALLTCLNVCGRVLEQRIPNLLKDCIVGLEAAKRDLKLEQHVTYKITEIIELRGRHWIALEPITPIPPTMPRTSEYRRDTPNRNMQQHATRKFDSQGALNVPSLALSGTKNAQNDKFLGPQKNWTQGSSSNQVSNRNLQQSRFNLLTQMGSGANSESESRKDAFPPCNSPKKHKISVPIKRDNICDKIETSEAIREAVEAFTLSDTPSYDLLVLDSEKSTFIEEILTKFIDKSSEDRKIVANIISHIYNKNQLTNNHILQGFGEFLEKCNDDFLIDCPKADFYISEYLVALIFDTSENLDLLLEILNNLPETRRSLILARCLQLSSKQIGEEVISNIFVRSSINWPTFTDPSFREFAKKNGVEFLRSSKLSTSTSCDSISKEDKKNPVENEKFFIAKKNDFEALQKYFTGIANKNRQPAEISSEFLSLFLQNCSKQKKSSEKYVQILVMLADRSVDCDRSLLNTLQNRNISNEYFKQLLRLFVQLKVINKDSLSTLTTDPSLRKDYRSSAKDILESQR